MVTLKHKILLFGKTGQGKSTIANMLVSGQLLPDPVFKTGDGMHGVTDVVASHDGRGYHVVDTVGIGEATDSHRKEAAKLIYKFLKETQGEYSHILFVTAAGRFDQLDDDISKLFPTIFEGVEPAFGVIVTKCNKADKWKQENETILQEKIGKFIPPDRYMYVNFPPLDDEMDPEMEDLLWRKRDKSLDCLEASLDRFFHDNKFQYYKPKYTSATDADLLELANRVLLRILESSWKYTRKFVVDAAEFIVKAVQFFGDTVRDVGIEVSEYTANQLKSWKAYFGH